MDSYTYDDLCRILERLRSDDGCPWDRQQTHESLRAAILEEVYEFVDALDRKDTAGMCEELGDVLMLTVFHGRLAEEAGSFTNQDVISGICHKMITRHSHVFGKDKAEDPEEALLTWERNKSVEKAYAGIADALRSIPRVLPSLSRAQKLQSRAEKLGVSHAVASFERLLEAANKLKNLEIATEQQQLEQIGSFLWEVADFSRLFEINADFALTNVAEKFINRFETMESGLER